jgi:hypothetical protein
VGRREHARAGAAAAARHTLGSADSFPGRDNSKDTVAGTDGKSYTSDQATIWRWRKAFQHDFAARMDWTIKEVRVANHNPEVVVNGQSGRAPLHIDGVVGTAVTLDATGTKDPDGDRLTYTWFLYPEAGTGIPSRPVVAERRTRDRPARITLQNASDVRATVVPNVAGVAHIIVAVEDSGTPSLTAYRRVILNTKAAGVR